MRNRFRRKAQSTWRKFVGSVVRIRPHYAVERTFHSHHYLHLTMRTLEHLASLALPLRDRSVLEVGAGAGDFSSFFLDRECRTTITDVRPELLAYLQRRYPQQDIRRLDLDQPASLTGAPFEVVFCYGVLYHLQHPAQAIAYLSDCCSDLLLVASQVNGNDEIGLTEIVEPGEDFEQAYHGRGTRFTRGWLHAELRRHFPYVYTPRTQPVHSQFPCNWTAVDGRRKLVRAIFVAARQPLANPLLTEQWLNHHDLQP